VGLKIRAYTENDIKGFVSKTSFEKCKILESSMDIGMEIWLEK
jgi:hypothetical protein